MENRIISMSLHDDVFEEIDSLTKDMGFKGRSETIRAGIKSLSTERKERKKLRGKINATSSVVHNHAKNVGKLTHEYQEIMVSHLHNHFDNNKCLDIFVLKGDSSLIRDLTERFQKNKKIEQVRLVVC